MEELKNSTIEKKELRREILKRREALSVQERERASTLLAERIIGHQWFYRAEVLLGFVNYGSEISTVEILSEALKHGKKVYVPRVEGEDLIFYRIFSMEDLIPGYKGIPEPAGDTERYQYRVKEQALLEKTLLLMPGVAFDPMRNRMGYGKGFYDRFLADKEELQIYSIAVGYQCQMVEQVPASEHDIKPYQVICV